MYFMSYKAVCKGYTHNVLLKFCVCKGYTHKFLFKFCVCKGYTHKALHKTFAGDSLQGHNGYKFTTKDRDNDIYNNGSCAKYFKGGWWYERCHDSNLNGLYLNGAHNSFADGVNWRHWKKCYYSLSFIEMKVKRKK